MDDAFQLFKSDIESQDVEYMVDAANKLTIVAAAIGKARTASELIPYLPKVMTIPSDEVLAAIGRQLYNLWDIAGGPSSLNDDAISIIFSCLRQLGDEEEIIVRQSAVIAFTKILPTLSTDAITTHLIPLFQTFAVSDTFGSRHTAASIIHLAYRYGAPSSRDEIKQILTSLSQDETPMVRRVIAKVLPQFAQAVTDISTMKGMTYNDHIAGYDLIKKTIIPIIQQLSIDERDYLRDLAPQALTGLISHLPLSDYNTYLLPIIEGLGDDLSWKVRQQLCQQCPLFIATLLKRATYQYEIESKLLYPNNDTEQQEYKNAMTTNGGTIELNLFISSILKIYKKLVLHDINLEVRSIGVLIMTDMFYLANGIVPNDLFSNFPREPIFTAKATEQDSLTLDLQFPSPTPPHKKKPYQRPTPTSTIFTINHQNICDEIGYGFTELARDLSSLSKVDLCEVIASLSPFVGFEYVNRYIIPVINHLAQDDHVQVRSTIILCLEPVLATCPPDIIITQLWPIFDALYLDLRWRVRRAVATQITPLCYYLKNNTEFIQTSLLPMIEALLSENVHAVRNRTAVEFRSLIPILGIDAVIKHFLPFCVDLFNPKANYLHRITALHFIYFCATAYDNTCPKSQIVEHFTPFFIEALQDQVPNVRILAIRYVIELMKNPGNIWDKTFINSQLLPLFQSMAKDSQQDREVILQGNNAIALVSTLK